MQITYPLLKRLMDLCVAIILLVILAPVILLVSFLILIIDGRPIIFRQMRPGYLGRPFLIYKFRTMKDLKDKNGNFLPDENRLTSLGKILRRTSLDELPELWNVIRGEMSLVGPRALLMEYLMRYTPEQARRHEAKPGITGWAQINGRNAISWEEKFKLDVWYVDNLSFWLDLKILIMTIIKVIIIEGIAARGHATMPEFQGLNK